MLALRVPLVLASQSPRRRQLLSRLGLTFHVAPSHAPEDLPEGLAPGPAAEALARLKAETVAPHHPEALTLAADTVVVLDGDFLEKPADPEDAARMLRRLSGATHTVHTGIALAHPPSARLVSTHETTGVTFAPLTDAEIAAYVATGSPMDKAGAYGIQDDLGALFVEGVAGDYYNVAAPSGGPAGGGPGQATCPTPIARRSAAIRSLLTNGLLT